MKMKKFVSLWKLRVLLAFVLSSLCLQVGFATESLTSIPLKGVWEKVNRSLNPIAPITASIENSILFISNSSPNRDITIDIVDENGMIVYTQKVPAINTANVVIPITELPSGNYKLELRSPFNDYLYGNFAITSDF